MGPQHAPERGRPPEGGSLGRFPAILERHGPAWALALLLAITAVAWLGVRARARDEQAQRFHEVAGNIAYGFKDRMGEYELVLEGARGLFAQGNPVQREGWARYVAGLDLDRHRPGIQGVGYAKALGPGEGPQVEAEARQDGNPEFHLWPDRDQAASAIVLLEPRAGRNLRAIGYDMFSEPVRRTAMALARDRGTTAVSGKVTLVQEDQPEPQAGVLMYLPIFPGGRVPDSEAERRNTLIGWVYSPFRMGDFSRGVLGGDLTSVRVEVFDGEHPNPEHLLFDGAPGTTRRPAWQEVVKVPLPGREWTCRISSLAPFEAGEDRATPLLVLAGGSIISFLIHGLLLALLRLQRRARALAQEMTAALREEKEHVRRILDSTSEGIYGLDLQGRCTFVNQAFLRMSGCTAEDLLGRSVHETSHHSHPDGTPYPVERCPIYKALKAGAQIRLEDEWFWRRDGSGYWANVVAAPILIDGAVMGSVVTIEDISHKREAEQAKHAFISVVSHELRTPLTSIRGTLGLLASGLFRKDPGEADRLVGIAMRNAERLSTLINDILDFEKLRSGRMLLDLQTVALVPLLAEVMDVNLPFAATHGVHLAPATWPEGHWVRVDRKRLVQVLTNLLSNAIKFSPAGSEVALAVRTGSGRIWIDVIDHGRGIPEAFRSRIFTPFSQAEAPEVRSQEGSGLGLSIAKALIEDMGGALTFETEEGRGSTFTVELPEGQRPMEG